MCRLVAYLGRPILMEKLLIEPKNSLINQSFNAREIEEPLNGDGFGVGWYNHILSDIPAVFKSITPAWSNINLRSISPIVKSSCFMAHVRAASVGSLGENNCHPFAYKQFLMMHNGDVPEFSKLKRPIRNQLSDEAYGWIEGQTDTEHLFAMFIDELNSRLTKQELTASLMAESLEAMIRRLEKLKNQLNVNESAYLNMVVTDGERTTGMRYVSNKNDDPLSLYYSEGSKYECIDGVCHMLPAEDGQKSLMIVSEKLTEFASDWREIPKNHCITINKDLKVNVRALTI